MRKGLGRHNYRSAGSPQPSLILDFTNTNTLDSRITFTRSTTATYYNSSGVLSTAAINVPRFTYNPSTKVSLGLLVEQSSTNSILYSQDYSSGSIWIKTNSTNTPNTITAPDGTLTGSTMTALGINSVLYRQNISALTNGQKYTYSRYVQAGTKNFCTLGLQGLADAYFDLVNLTTSFTGTGAVSASIQDVGNGWRRVSATWTWGSGTTYATYMAIASSLSSQAGITIGDYQYVWGNQFENLTFASSYVPTTAAQVTRAADIPPLPIDSWYNTSQGTWVAQVNMLSTDETPRIVGATPSSKAPMEISNQSAAMFDNVFGVSTANTITANTTQKIATAWTGTTGLVCLNNGTVATGSQVNGYANLSTVGIGYNSTLSDNFINGTIAKITYYPKALTSAQLQALTT